MKSKEELSYTDIEAIDFCIRIVKVLIVNFEFYKLTSENLHSLTKALIILETFPENTLKGFIEIQSSFRYNENHSEYISITIDGNNIEILSGGSIYTEGIGSDTLPTETLYLSSYGQEQDFIEWDEYENIFFGKENEKIYITG